MVDIDTNIGCGGIVARMSHPDILSEFVLGFDRGTSQHASFFLFGVVSYRGRSWRGVLPSFVAHRLNVG